MTAIPNPANFKIYRDYVTCCQSANQPHISASEFVQRWADRVEEIPQDARIAALELWRIEIDAWRERITGDGR